MAARTGTRIRIRKATAADEDALHALEWKGFTSDRFDRRQIRRLLTRANATTWLVEGDDVLQGAAIMLWREGSRVGHLYSIVVHPKYRGHGLGNKLLAVCEREAGRRGCERMVLEVRADNRKARRFYERWGYRVTEYLPAYYQEGADGLRMDKRLQGGEGDGPRRRPVAGQPGGFVLDIPYYAQTLDFTCGPACLMMAMRYLNPAIELGRTLELMLWKEATLIYMTCGLGGCGPFGLALAARRRGYRVTVAAADGRTAFLYSVRKPEKRTVIRLVHRELKAQALALGVSLEHSSFPPEEMAEALRRHVVPIVLVNTHRLHGVRVPHWVVVTGLDDEHVYFHDPYEGFYRKNNRHAHHVAVPMPEFAGMRRYARDLQRIAVLVGRR